MHQEYLAFPGLSHSTLHSDVCQSDYRKSCYSGGGLDAWKL